MKYFIENSRQQKLSMPLTYEVRVESADKNYVQGFTKDLSPTSCSCKDPLCCLTCLNITAVIQIYQIQSIVHEEQHGVFMNKSTSLCFIYVLYSFYINELKTLNCIFLRAIFHRNMLGYGNHHFETQTINRKSKRLIFAILWKMCTIFVKV